MYVWRAVRWPGNISLKSDNFDGNILLLLLLFFFFFYYFAFFFFCFFLSHILFQKSFKTFYIVFCYFFFLTILTKVTFIWNPLTSIENLCLIKFLFLQNLTWETTWKRIETFLKFNFVLFLFNQRRCTHTHTQGNNWTQL